MDTYSLTLPIARSVRENMAEKSKFPTKSSCTLFFSIPFHREKWYGEGSYGPVSEGLRLSKLMVYVNVF